MQTQDFVRGNLKEKMIMIEMANERQAKEYCRILLMQAEVKKLIKQRNRINFMIRALKDTIGDLNHDFEKIYWEEK